MFTMIPYMWRYSATVHIQSGVKVKLQFVTALVSLYTILKTLLSSEHHNGYTVHISHGYSYIQFTTQLHAHKSLEPSIILAPHTLKFFHHLICNVSWPTKCSTVDTIHPFTAITLFVFSVIFMNFWTKCVYIRHYKWILFCDPATQKNP